MTRLLITGGSGFIARNLARHLTPHYPHVHALSHAQFDVTNPRDCLVVLRHYAPDVVIHCAGDKDVKRCEANPTHAYALNAIAAGNVAKACHALNIKLLNVSTDYVRTGFIYGLSKSLGEQLTLLECPSAIICRSGGVYAPDAPWVTWLDGGLRAGRRVTAWGNVWNAPTYAGNLAEMMRAVMRVDVLPFKPRVLNLVGPEKVNRYELFRAYARAFGYQPDLIDMGVCDHAKHYLPEDVAMKSAESGISPVRQIGIAEGMAKMKEDMLKERMV